ncbi:hypothetical protein RhiirC2_781245 [Rhizophagus irregularis]|uniref:Uncharacterized protein n=1 Tax=Rhizophagus irregularis TaxID=588596 RepID=A0A2N1N5R2_9GLOM|nr:hypothetical protein RhiirC2_781245 [Rhizophagus irregularis]
MSVSEANPSEHEVLRRQRITELDAENAKTKISEFKARIEELEKNRAVIVAENAELRSRVAKLEQDIVELKKEFESKKNRKFQEKCILIAQVLLGEELIVEYCPSFMRGLELDAFF